MNELSMNEQEGNLNIAPCRPTTAETTTCLTRAVRSVHVVFGRGVLLGALFMSNNVSAYQPIVSRDTSTPTSLSRSYCTGLRTAKNNPETSVSDRRSFLDSSCFIVAGAAAWGIAAPFPATAMSTDPKTGILLPDLGEIENSIPKDWSGVENPFLGSDADPKTMFGRLDASPDTLFYTDPRFVEHVDDNAVQIMTNYISTEAMINISPGDDSASVLDLCSSWTSHVDQSRMAQQQQQVKRFAGLGMNAKELEANTALTEWTIQDLNGNPKLPYDDNSFDVVLCQLSIDYLTKPLDVLREAGRVLKPGGKIHILFSNRVFLSKAVGLWTGADDLDHVYYVGCYLHFCNGGYSNIVAKDLSIRKGREKRITGDPMYVVIAEKATL